MSYPICSIRYVFAYVFNSLLLHCENEKRPNQVSIKSRKKNDKKHDTISDFVQNIILLRVEQSL